MGTEQGQRYEPRQGGGSYTDKKENEIFLIYREIQNEVVAKL